MFAKIEINVQSFKVVCRKAPLLWTVAVGIIVDIVNYP
jgi:hypothetical protein